MDTIHGEGAIHINRSPDEVFEFLCDPDVDPAELTPLEDRITDWQALCEVGSTSRVMIEFAARKLNCLARCTAFEPSRLLATRLEGDLEGEQVWQLAPESGGTRLHLALDFVEPVWLPTYLQDDTTAARWGERLAEATLANVKAALEGTTH